ASISSLFTENSPPWKIFKLAILYHGKQYFTSGNFGNIMQLKVKNNWIKTINIQTSFLSRIWRELPSTKN
ncbi:MAG: hypothetical protein IJO00_01060, partial [Clostridia bacterium]|nr:hypothetical protein [Clostridia bacterium]